MPNRRKPQSEKRSKGLTLSLREREYDIIERLANHMGLTKTDLILSAIKKQYSKSALAEDHTSDYIALLKEQMDLCEERIERERNMYERLKEEYDKMVQLRTGGGSSEED